MHQIVKEGFVEAKKDLDNLCNGTTSINSRIDPC